MTLIFYVQNLNHDYYYQDLGGQEELQTLWDKYYSESHGIIYMIDSTDRNRLEESWKAFDKMIQNEQLVGLPLLVSCNKQDLDDCMSVPEIKKVFNKSATNIGTLYNTRLFHQYYMYHRVFKIQVLGIVWLQRQVRSLAKAFTRVYFG